MRASRRSRALVELGAGAGAGAGAGVARMRGDDFLDPVRSHLRSSDWDGVERGRLADEVLRPFREGRRSEFRPFDWSARRLGEPRPLPSAEVLVVDLIGLFHPETVDLLDLRVWVDLDLETAARRGKARDEALGRRHDRLWDEVWVPNERDFARRFGPRDQAHLIVDTR
ncbi:uridine kinase [Agromyces sp. NPDC058136]|uniref:uridine kinase family protein n=1 Tax=Agromyces sp. NPDC058136 TaxID=3346354 RepID=UPI0036D8F565